MAQIYDLEGNLLNASEVEKPVSDDLNDAKALIEWLAQIKRQVKNIVFVVELFNDRQPKYGSSCQSSVYERGLLTYIVENEDPIIADDILPPEEGDDLHE